MKIRIVNEEHRFTLPLPNWLLLNSLSAAICTSALNNRRRPENPQEDIRLSFIEIRRLFIEIRKCRHYLKGEPLVYVHSGDGDIVEIFL